MPQSLQALLDWPLLTTAAIIAVAGVIRGFTGFGSALVLTPALAALYGPQAALPLIVLLEVGLSFQLLPAAWKLVDRRSVLLLAAASLATVPLGGWVLATAEPRPLRWAISGGILVFLALLLAGVRRRGPVTRGGLVLAGVASGFANGVAGVGGPPVVLYYLAGGTTAAVVRATVIVFFFLLHGATLGWQALQGNVTPGHLLLAAATLPASLAGVWLGTRLFALASDRIFRLVALLLIGAVAVAGAAVG